MKDWILIVAPIDSLNTAQFPLSSPFPSEPWSPFHRAFSLPRKKPSITPNPAPQTLNPKLKAEAAYDGGALLPVLPLGRLLMISRISEPGLQELFQDLPAHMGPSEACFSDGRGGVMSRASFPAVTSSSAFKAPRTTKLLMEMRWKPRWT